MPYDSDRRADIPAGLGSAEDTMFAIGIAGHVDHGKTSLVRALTGVDTDRLPEEKRRGISIEPGYARLVLDSPDGPQSVSLVDLPGHEKFVRRMVCGAQGLQALLLVVAADGGVMPQTREHLAIAQLLGVRHGLVVVSRCDLVEPDWLPLVEDEIRAELADTPLRDAQLVRASVRQPQTLDAVRAALLAVVSQLPQAVHNTERPFRLAVERVLSIAGHGTVATGNAEQGQLKPAEEVEVVPGGARFRVRGLAQHGTAVTVPDLPGRLAVQLAGAEVAEVPLGSWLAAPQSLRSVQRLDAALTLLPHAPPLDVRASGLLLLGTADATVRIVQLSGTPQLPGTTAFVQLHLDRPLGVPGRARFVLRGFARDARHGWTVGGGLALSLDPPRHALGDASVLAALLALSGDADSERVLGLARLHGVRGVGPDDLTQQLGLVASQHNRVLRPLLAAGQLRWAGPHLLVPEAIAWLEQRLLDALDAFHQRQPGQPGLQSSALIAQTASWLEPALVAAVTSGLVRRGALKSGAGEVLSLPGFVPQLLASDVACAALLAELEAAGLAATGPAGLAAALGLSQAVVEAGLAQLARAGAVQRVANDYFAASSAVDAAVVALRAAFADQPSLSTAALKDVLGLTRKHLIPFLEYLDASRITLRTASGDRVLRKAGR